MSVADVVATSGDGSELIAVAGFDRLPREQAARLLPAAGRYVDGCLRANGEPA